MKSKQSKIYNPKKDKIKIVDGDLFEFSGRIGPRISHESPPKIKSENEIVNYSYPLKVL